MFREGTISFKLIAAIVAVAILGAAILSGLLRSKFFEPAVCDLPQPIQLLLSSKPHSYPVLKGMKVYPDNPLKFDFIVDTGDADIDENNLKVETSKLVRYFLASLAIPEEDLWVNLSPYEKDRVIPEKLGMTEMGVELLAQDYILKQLMSSLTYPESELGKKFWDRVYAKVNELYGAVDMPINTFSKVWIMPEKVLIHVNGDTAFVVEGHLKVMLESDYLAFKKNLYNLEAKTVKSDIQNSKEINDVSSSIMKEIILPEIEREVNQGEHFAKLRQAFYSMVLATWFKRNLKEGLLGKSYADKGEVSGVDVEDKELKNEIYQQYVKAYRAGVYNYIKKEYDLYQHKAISRKYFSGGYTHHNPDAIQEQNVSSAVLENDIKHETHGEAFVAQVYIDVAKKLDHLYGVLDRIALSKEPEFMSLPKEAKEDDIMMAVIKYLKRRDNGKGHLITEDIDSDGNIIYILSDRLKVTTLGEEVVQEVMKGADGQGVKVIHLLLPGTDGGQGVIVGFQGEIKQQKEREKEELRWHKGGEFEGQNYGQGMSAFESSIKVAEDRGGEHAGSIAEIRRMEFRSTQEDAGIAASFERDVSQRVPGFRAWLWEVGRAVIREKEKILSDDHRKILSNVRKRLYYLIEHQNLEQLDRSIFGDIEVLAHFDLDKALYFLKELLYHRNEKVIQGACNKLKYFIRRPGYEEIVYDIFIEALHSDVESTSSYVLDTVLKDISLENPQAVTPKIVEAIGEVFKRGEEFSSQSAFRILSITATNPELQGEVKDKAIAIVKKAVSDEYYKVYPEGEDINDFLDSWMGNNSFSLMGLSLEDVPRAIIEFRSFEIIKPDKQTDFLTEEGGERVFVADVLSGKEGLDILENKFETIWVQENEGMLSEGLIPMRSHGFSGCHAVLIRDKCTDNYALFHFKREAPRLWGKRPFRKYIEYLGDGEKEAIYLSNNMRGAMRFAHESEEYLARKFGIKTLKFVEVNSGKHPWSLVFRPTTKQLIVYSGKEAYIFNAFAENKGIKQEGLPLTDSKTSTGGIDFDSAMWDLQTQGEATRFNDLVKNKDYEMSPLIRASPIVYRVFPANASYFTDNVDN
ncbi:MAG: hypothetical protein GY858_08625 [Candidatus Omnitrophica bacterium]|nr:hypothetical protein [Candidatus Omnitrophota bacterium]